MKIFKSTLTFLLLMSVFSLATLSAQNSKRVLLEEFTNASCGPCAAQNPAFKTLLDANASKVVPVKWQTSWPGYDPFYAHNSQENGDRTDYYPDVDGVPAVKLNGGGTSQPNGITQAGIDAAYAQMTPISMVMTHAFNSDYTMVDVNLTITNDGATDFALAAGKVHVILLEDEVIFPTAPGSNGETEFYQIAIKMLTGVTGEDLPTLAAGASHTVMGSYEVPNYTYDLRQFRVAAFVQDDTDKAVHQSTITDPDPVAEAAPYNDLSLAATTAAPTSLCGASVTPTLTITNDGDLDITGFIASYTLSGGGTPVTQEWTGTLAPGASEMVNFPEVILTERNATLSYDVEIVGAGDFSPVNNSAGSPIYNSISETPIGSGYAEDNESYDPLTYPSIAAIQTPFARAFVIIDQSLFGNPPGPLGGFAASERSLWVNFYSWQSGSASMTYDKISLVGVTGAALSFDRAYAQYVAENDALEISVSTDCGDNWSSIYQKAGADLMTSPPVGNNTPFYPTSASQWQAEWIDISQYDGAEEIIVRFTVTTDYGNNLFLDNINLSSAVGNINLNLLEGIELDVTPNPVVDAAKINIALESSLTMDIAIYDLSGKLVRNLAQGQDFVAGDSSVDWDVRSNEGAAVPNGMYIIRVTSAEGQITSKVMVAK